MNIPSFEETLKDANGDKKFVLLGNGFSQECCKANNIDNVFNYPSLLEVIAQEKISETHTIGELFNHLETTDFEFVLYQLNQARIYRGIIELFMDSKSDVHNNMQREAEAIRGGLANAIMQIHPSHQYDKVNDQSYEACSKFINNFDSVYTLNYDLLIYWAQMKAPELKSKLVDGFWNVINEKNYWDANMKENLFDYAKNIYYLHGALHLFIEKENDQLPYKVKSNDGRWLLTEIRQQITNGHMPICVTEGSSGHKLDKIYKNEYLKHCYQSLIEEEGSLFTYGVSFNNDEHILNAIKSNRNIKNIYVGVLEYDSSPFERAKRIMGDKKSVKSFNATKVLPWGYQEDQSQETG